MNITTRLTSLFCLLAVGGVGWSQTELTEHTLRLDEQSESPAAGIGDIHWLHGFWNGEGLGGQADESWSAAAAGTMVGTFRLIKDNQVQFSEFIEISEKSGSLILKVKHFDRDLNGWEEKDDSVEFPLVRLTDKTAMFSGLTYTIDDQENLRAYVALKQRDGTYKEGEFVFRRLSSSKLAASTKGKDVVIELPQDPEAVVLTYKIEGGYRMPTPVNFVPTPFIRLLANGKVLVGRNSPNVPELEYQLTDEELEDLLREIIVDRHFFDISTDELKQQMEDTGKPVRVADAPTHRIFISLADKKHEVDSYGLAIIRNMFKGVDDLQDLAAIHDKLMFLRSRAALGTQEEVERLLDEMKTKYRKRFSVGEPFTLDNLKSASVNKDDSMQAQFTRVEYENKQPKFVYNCFVQKEGDKTTMNFSRAMVR